MAHEIFIPELLRNVVSNLEGEDWFAATLVCKSWAEEGRSLLTTAEISLPDFLGLLRLFPDLKHLHAFNLRLHHDAAQLLSSTLLQTPPPALECLSLDLTALMADSSAQPHGRRDAWGHHFLGGLESALEHLRLSLTELHCAALPDVAHLVQLKLLRSLNISLAPERPAVWPVSLKALTALDKLRLLGLAADTPTHFCDFSALTGLASLRQLSVGASFMLDSTDEHYVRTVRSEFSPLPRMTQLTGLMLEKCLVFDDAALGELLQGLQSSLRALSLCGNHDHLAKLEGGWAGLHDMQLEWLAADFGYISAPTAGHLADALAAQSRLHTLSLGVPGGEDEDSARMLLGAVRSLGAGLTALRMTCGDPVMGQLWHDVAIPGAFGKLRALEVQAGVDCVYFDSDWEPNEEEVAQVEAALHRLTGLESLSAPQLTLARLPTGASSPLAALTRCRRLQLAPCADDLACLAGMATLEQLDLVLRVRDAAGANCLTVLGRLSRLTALQLTGAEDGCGDGGMAANGHDGDLLCTDLDSVLQAISSCTSVVDLNIRGCSGLSDAGIRALAPLTRLRRLQISAERVAQLPSFPTVLRQLPRLRCLNLQPASMVPQEPAGGAAKVAREARSRDIHDKFDFEFCNDPFSVPGVPDKMYLRHFRSDPASRSAKRLVSGGCGSIIGSAVVMPWHDPASDCFMPSLLACDLPAVDSLCKEDEEYD